MATAQDLMGLGVAPMLASRTASGGIGPLTMSTGASSTFAATVPTFRIGATQFLVSVNSGVSTGGIALPVVGGDAGAFIGDQYIINNAGTTTIFLFASAGVLISVAAANTYFTQIPLHTTMTVFPVTTTQWVGVKGS